MSEKAGTDIAREEMSREELDLIIKDLIDEDNVPNEEIYKILRSIMYAMHMGDASNQLGRYFIKIQKKVEITLNDLDEEAKNCGLRFMKVINDMESKPLRGFLVSALTVGCVEYIKQMCKTYPSLRKHFDAIHDTEPQLLHTKDD